MFKRSQIRPLFQQNAVLLKAAAAKLEALQAENEQLKKRERVTKLAESMEDKNISPSWGSSLQSKVDHLMRLDETKLASVEQSIEWSAPQQPFASLFQDDRRGDGNTSSVSRQAIDAMILGYK